MYQNRDFNKIRIVFGYEFLLYTLVAISIDSDNFTCYLNPIIIILYKAGFPLVTSARQTKKENAAGRQIADPLLCFEGRSAQGSKAGKSHLPYPAGKIW